MHKDSSPSELWLRVVVWTAAVSTLGALVAMHLPPRVNTAVCSIEFTNRSGLMITNLELGFSFIDPRAGTTIEEYHRRFERRFTNVAPGMSIVVRTNAPMLKLGTAMVTHQDYVPSRYAEVFQFSGIRLDFSEYHLPVAATPEKSARLIFLGYHQFEVSYGN
jgi:hypothetical protein